MLVTSDLHLSPRIWRHRNILQDSYFAWECICDFAQSENVDCVVLAGDVLDKQANNSESIIQLIKGLERLEDAGIPVLVVQGQHEYQKDPWVSLSRAVWINDDIHTLRGWNIGGSDFKAQAEFQDFLKSSVATESDVLVCHQVWKDLMGEVAVTQGSFEDVPSNVQLLITGDFHEHLKLRSRNTVVLSPGSTHMRSITEQRDKSVFMVTLYPDREMDVVSLDLPSRCCVDLDLTELLSVADHGFTVEDILRRVGDLLEDARIAGEDMELPAELRKPLLYVRHFKSDSEFANAIHKTYAEHAHVFFKQMADKVEDSLLPVPETVYGGISMTAYLPEFIDVNDSRAMSLAMGLVSSEDAGLYLENWLSENESESE